MEKFCKLYETETYGQILVKLDHALDNTGSEIRVYVQPENFGVCSIALFYGNSDEDWDLAEKEFSEFTQEKAEKYALTMFDMVKEN